MGIQNFNSTTPAAPGGTAQVQFQTDAGNPTRNNSAYVAAATSVVPGVIALAGDLGNNAGAPQVLSTHLAAPLPIAQGGTGNNAGLSSGHQDTVTAINTSGEIDVKTGVVIITAGSAAALTLALPTAGGPGVGDDGKVLTIQSNTAFAHSVTTPTNGLNGSEHTATFGGAIGDCLTLCAYAGSWLVRPSVNQTIT